MLVLKIVKVLYIYELLFLVVKAEQWVSQFYFRKILLQQLNFLEIRFFSNSPWLG